ncbi:MAG: PilZ domain-containing protein [Sphingomonas bacterium]|nr:PilZ domain-containing protein [Sphingomonas bacterium]
MNSFRSALNKGEGLHPSGPLMPGKKPSGANESKGLGSVPVAREATRNVDHRDDDRHRLQAEHATLKVARKNHEVDLINLSGGGAMIRTDVELAMWQKVHLGLGDCQPVECAVRWIRGDRIGLEFAHETQVGGDSDQRDAMLLDALQRSFPESASPAAPAKPPVAPAPARPVAEPTGEQRRTELRHPLIWWGEIHYNHDTNRVRLRNISEQGALVDSDVAFASDAEVLLDLGAAGQHFATVTWSRGDQVGLRFASPFDIASLAKVKPEVATHQWARPSYLKSGRQTEADWANGWQSPTVNQLRDDLEGFLKR